MEAASEASPPEDLLTVGRRAFGALLPAPLQRRSVRLPSRGVRSWHEAFPTARSSADRGADSVFQRPPRRRRRTDGVDAEQSAEPTPTVQCKCKSQEHQKSFGSRLWSSQRFTDCTVVCTNALSQPCHRAVLAEASPVLERMLSSEMREASEQVITIQFDQPHVVRAMIEFIYCGEVAVLREDLLPLLSLADQYDIEALALACSVKVLDCLNPDNIVSVVRALKGFAERPRLKESWQRLCEKLRADPELLSAAMMEL